MHAGLENSHPWEVLLNPFITWDAPSHPAHSKSIKQKVAVEKHPLDTCDSAVLGLPRSATTRLVTVSAPQTVGIRTVMWETYRKPYLKGGSQHV